MRVREWLGSSALGVDAADVDAVTTDSDVRHRASRRGNDDENSLLTRSRLHSRIAVRLPVVVVANVPRDVTPRARPSPPRVVTPAVCGFPFSTGGGSRARSTACECVHKNKNDRVRSYLGRPRALYHAIVVHDRHLHARARRKMRQRGTTRGRRSLANDRAPTSHPWVCAFFHYMRDFYLAYENTPAWMRLDDFFLSASGRFDRQCKGGTL